MCFGVVVFAHVRLLFWLSHLNLYICHVNVSLCNIEYLCIIVPRAFARGKDILDVAIVF